MARPPRIQKITCRVPRGESKSTLRLDDAIAASPEAMAHKLSRSLIRKLLIAGAVYVNGKRIRLASRTVKGGEIIDLYWDNSVSPQVVTAERFLPLRVLYEDEAIICFDKPAGLASQPTVDQARVNLFDLARHQVSHSKSTYIGMHHRLDRDTSGVILFTRDPKYNSWVAEQFRGHKLVKTYAAVVHGKLQNPNGRLESFLGPVGKAGKQARFGSVKSGGRKAITDYHVLASNSGYSLVQIRIQTGRTHQIRVHFSEQGHPIVGDTLYGSPIDEYRRLGRFLLHAQALSIEHPITQNVVRIESPTPPEFRL